MTDKTNEEFSRLLEIFDKQELNDIHGRRTAYKPLYEYFQRLIAEVGVRLCSLNRDIFNNYQLNGRWDVIKGCLILIEDAKIWDDLIHKMNKIRNGVEHKDNYDPELEMLKNIREKAPEFKTWVIRVGIEYFKTSINFTFIQSFYQLTNLYLSRDNLFRIWRFSSVFFKI
ncbi:hypothetical protein A2Z22_00755 [Candidatus Woesebacteria bacterium RBG_16_34_12]|uniref:Uncharacterized protein n=1 Tax=Candidatus Woesebacteria bacterium RBG_16_34_12 TaxID=1802480 RepID=A0A1F7X743_9BACT|nr:MAG: hypothetical protein A2Z22_00755 [Candidatus Woesebacteria bacterium RBG_16_34_12]